MKIVQVKPFYFRAFGDNGPIVFNDCLTVFYGGNGAGKSSLSEALEWLFYGYTKRRRKGDQYSKNEYKGSYVHSACPNGIAPFVEAEIRLADGSTHLVRRTIMLNKLGLPQDQESVLSIDGNMVNDFSPLNLSYTEAHCPVIVQHGIQDFIHTRPIDRYRVISEALGVSDLVEFKDILERAKIHRRNNPLTEVAQAKATVTQMVGKLKSIGLTELATRWQSEDFSINADLALILNKARELSGSQASTKKLVLEDVRTRQIEEINKVFNITPFRPSSKIANELNQFPVLLERIREADEKFKSATASYAGATASSYQILQLEFWKQGLNLLAPDQEKCPFCEEQTITSSKIQDLRTRLEADENLTKSRLSFQRETDLYVSVLSDLESRIPQFEFSALSNEDEATLEKLFETDQTRLTIFSAENRQSVSQVKALREYLTQARNSLSGLKTSITQPDKASAALIGVVDIPSKIENCLTNVLNILKQYGETFATFAPIFERELSDEAAVTRFTSLIDILTNYDYIRVLAEAKAFDNEILESQRAAEEYILAQQKSALAGREKDILTWYDLLSPNPDVKFTGIEPGRSEFVLTARAFGRSMNAAASLSQSQLNCLGLSIYIPSISAADSPFRFILFDDPVQAMDDEHHESFLLKVVPKLVKNLNFQVVVLTHLKETADRLRDINFTGNFLYYRFDKLEATGPVVVEHLVLSESMKRIRTLAQGNDDIRQIAVDRIRVLCENIMRESYLRHMGVSLPITGGTATNMIPFFAKIPNVKTNMVTDLQDTIGWSNPAHHTLPGYIVPATATINPHIERLQGIINDLGLKK